MVQMCASFRYRSVKTHFLLLPPELLPPELLPLCLLWKLCYPIQLPSQYGCPKSRLFQHNHMLVVSRIDSVLLKLSHLNSFLPNPFPPILLTSLGGRRKEEELSLDISVRETSTHLHHHIKK